MRHLTETSRASPPRPSGTDTDRDSSSLTQIEVLVCLSAFLLLFLVVFSLCRRRYNNNNFRLIMFTSHITSTYVLTYVLGLMHEYPVSNEFFPVWAMFLMVVIASGDSFSAYQLDDNEQWKTYNSQIAIKFVCLGLLLTPYASKDKPTQIAIYCLIVVLVLKSHEKAYALAAASRKSLERNTKVIFDYMIEQDGEHSAANDAGAFCMKDCYYLVRGEEDKWESKNIFTRNKRLKEEMTPAPAPEYRTRLKIKDNEVITLKEVWNCNGALLNSEGDPNNKLKDYCLSFALFKLLRLKYAGYSLPQHVHQKTRNLIQKELLSQPNSHRRAFRIVERELSYLFDLFYTKYGVIFHPGRLHLKLIEFVYFSIGIYAARMILDNYKGKHADDTTGAFVSSTMILAFIAAELVQFFFTCFSDWAKLILICKYVQKKSWQGKIWRERMVKFMCRVQLLQPWERKLGQYSFLKSYSYEPCALLYNRISASYIDQKRNGQRQSKRIKLSEDVKEAVFNSLKSNYGANLENGQVSLGLNKVSNLSWACKLKTQAQVILVWHIATSLCKQELVKQKRHKFRSNTSKTDTRNIQISTNLSNYLAYLVVFAPQLLPDHPYITEYVFDQAILEAKSFFKNCRCMCLCICKRKKIYDQIKGIQERGKPSVPEELTVIRCGAWLGKQIVDEVKDKAQIWKILADFWVEMTLYVAPSDNTKAHAEHLALGGEFVTHLWALLSHAGIERRVPSKPTVSHKRSNSSPS